jgi:nitronate monooxygenase
VIPSVVLAPLAGGPSTPELAAAVANAGGLGFIAAGYLAPEELAARIERARRLTDGPLGVNLFVLDEHPVDEDAVAAYARELQSEGGELGVPRFDDDRFAEKLAIAVAAGVDVISTTFGPPPAALVAAARAAGIDVWATVASAADAQRAVAAGVDALVVQGSEAGGHRASFDDTAEADAPLLELLAVLRDAVDVPLVASGGIGDRATADAARAAGAAAVQAGTVFLLCPEAGTSPPHREAVARGGPTAITRAFTGRRARGIVNAFMRDHPNAPSAYPHIHYLTGPLRAAARAAGDVERINLWAGTRVDLARERPAADVVAELRP